MILTNVLLKIIKYYPVNDFKIELEKIIILIVNFLKIKDSSLKRKAYGSLVHIGRLIGPHLLLIIIKEIIYHLSEGVLRHTRNYAIWYILD
jgi:hypothetical protein